MRAHMGEEGHGVAALAHLATEFAHAALVLLALAVDLLRVLQHVLVDLAQQLLVLLLDVHEQVLLRLEALRALDALEGGPALGQLLHTVLLVAQVGGAGQVLVQVALRVEGLAAHHAVEVLLLGGVLHGDVHVEAAEAVRHEAAVVAADARAPALAFHPETRADLLDVRAGPGGVENREHRRHPGRTDDGGLALWSRALFLGLLLLH